MANQFQADRWVSAVEAVEHAARYARATPAPDIGGIHVEPLFDGPSRVLLGYTVKITDRDGFAIGYVRREPAR